jgi:ribosomal protein L33
MEIPIAGNYVGGTNAFLSNTAGGQSGNGTLTVGSSSSSYLSNPNGFGASASLSGEPVKKAKLRSASKESKSIETGRVELGSTSEQKLQTVNKSFNQWAFHTVEYKLLPISQKVNTVEDLNIKRYCPNCGNKINKTDKFCSNCGQKL